MIELGENRMVSMVRRWAHRPWCWLKVILGKRSLSSPEFEQAATLFRLQRYGVALPRLLAVGHRFVGPGRMASFLALEQPRHAVDLFQWLLRTKPTLSSSLVGGGRHEVIRQLGALCRQLHDAGYFLDMGSE